LLPFEVVREIYHSRYTRSASIKTSAGSTTGTQLKDVSQEASDSVEDGGINQDFGECEADGSIPIESLSLKRRSSQCIINKGGNKAKIAIHE